MPQRAEVWEKLGAPSEQIGSVNDPRTHEEQGVRWNEKWIYRSGNPGRTIRTVLWYRYDFQGMFRVNPDASVEPETLPD